MDNKKIDSLLEELTKKNSEYSKLCMNVAETRRVVSELYAKKILGLQKLGTHITLVKDLAKGSDVVLDAKHKVVIAELKMKECSDSIKTIQVKMGMV